MNSPSAEKMQELYKRLNDTTQIISSQMQLATPIHPDVADEYQANLTSLSEDLDTTTANWVPSDDKEADKQMQSIVAPYMTGVSKSLSAQVTLATAFNSINARERFELNLQMGGLQSEDLQEVVTDYHEAIDRFFSAQKELNGKKIHTFNPMDVTEYERMCHIEMSQLDTLASNAFRERIFTPSNIDVKENNPHQHLGRINLGFTNTVPNLQRIMAHEGAFGHQTHLALSAKSSYSHPFLPLMEGIAIFGEKHALDLIYPSESNDSNEPLKNILSAQRDMSDALGAAYEKLLFFDQVCPTEIATKLESGIMDKERITYLATEATKLRNVSFFYGSTPYYAGAKQVATIMTDAFTKIEGLHPDARAHAKTKAFIRLYTGNRPISVARSQIEEEIAVLIPKDEHPQNHPRAELYR